MARVAFLGLGQMGAPMAGRLLQAGHGLTVWDILPESGAALVQRGAELAPPQAAACLGADFGITMLADPEALESVAFGATGIAAALTRGQTVVEMSTVGPEAARGLHARLAPVAMVDAPVLGSVPEAAFHLRGRLGR
ncbi:MAG: NAD(P)-dependent oxidoreductase [Candidatus Dormibacteraeota bacterium]|nr:NAD(P)-dependent oxidoreductase [Candidatus Dormibacteraeota bacterium]